MKLARYLEWLSKVTSKDINKTEKVLKKADLVTKKSLDNCLTRNELLDRINTDIAEMKRRSIEAELVDSFQPKKERKENEESEFYYEKIR